MARPVRTDLLASASRLTALERCGLMDHDTDAEFERLVSLVARTVGVPVAFFSIITADAHFFKAATGLPAAAVGQVLPADTSICRHVVERRTWLLVHDALSSPLIGDLAAVRGGMVGAYAGVPVTSSDGEVLGALCTVEHAPRKWGMADLETLLDYACVVGTYAELGEARRALGAAIDRGPHALLAQRDNLYVHAPWAVEQARRVLAR